MQSAVVVGTLLQNRYRVLQILGQGGFGRTYLAADQGRFNEQCVVKEFIPLAGSSRFSTKATQLFQREAETLYQIEHPQIPKFRATFEQNQRLFLVQDYIQGPTYGQLIQQRQGSPFSETEVYTFLVQLLPVLAHIHSKGIIHRDISPDNIILRQTDQKPVLIDFGVVKEVVTRLQSDGATQATTVGKAGYAPSEQLQSGRAYPSSDLYALAVTALVLLTGKEPQELFDDTTLTWRWRPFAPEVSSGLAAVLNRALSYRPSERFQTVKEMVQALRNGGSVSPAAVTAQTAPRPTRQPSMSEMRTVAVGRPAPPTAQSTRVGTTQVSRSQTRAVPPSRDSHDNPWMLGAMVAGAAVLAGFGGWATVNYLMEPSQPRQEAVIQPLPAPEEGEDEPQPDPTPPPLEPEQNEPTDYVSNLELLPGEERTVEGTLGRGDTVSYQIAGEQGETLRATLAGEGVLLSVLGEGDRPLQGARRVEDWQGTLPTSGSYTVRLQAARGEDQRNYALNLGLTAAPEDDTENSSPDPVDPGTPPPAEPPVQEQVSSQRVSFSAGENSAQVANSVTPGNVRRYIVNARQGQIATIRLTQASGPVTFDVIGPDGEPIPEAEKVLYWNSYLPLGGDYAVDVRSSAPADFAINIQVTGQ